MGKLADWSASQPAWVADALMRAATSLELGQGDVDALVNRIAIAHNLAVSGEHPCQAFTEASVLAADSCPDDVILYSVGPVEGLDRLAPSQKLSFALDGITVVFGENGSGKSGYTRALRRLCNARVEPALQGNVFAEGAEPPMAISYTYRRGEDAPVTETWRAGAPSPEALAGVTLLDADNLKVYIENKNEVLYLPPEVACVRRLADLYNQAAERFRGWIDQFTRQHGAPFGSHFPSGTTAALLSEKLQIATPQDQLPTEHQLRMAGTWNAELEAELSRLNVQLVEGPGAVAARNDRISAACLAAADGFSKSYPCLEDSATEQDGPALARRDQARKTAEVTRSEQIGAQPIMATGNETWRNMFLWARQFAAEANLKASTEAFVGGDLCPLCQQALSDDAATRLASFDAYIEGRAAQEANAADQVISTRIASLRELTFSSEEDLLALLGETSAHGPDAALLVRQTVALSKHLQTRRDARVQQLETGAIQPLSPMPPSPVEGLRSLARQLAEQSALLRSSDDQTAVAIARINELTAQKQLHAQMEQIVERRNALDAMHCYRKCEAALNTGPLSRLVTSLQKELTSPDLKARIQNEIAVFGLEHVPLRFSDETQKGASYFEVELDTGKKAKKARVMSEGEQRALSLACFLAETHVAGKRSAIILDDPVNSLDHGRTRRVARRLVEEAAKGRQIIVFTHNLVFYHELMLACVDRPTAVKALPCLIQQDGSGAFGLVSVDTAPWVAKKVKDREPILKAMIDGIPDDLTPGDDTYRSKCTSFYAALRETWERAVEELVLNDVVRRFGTDVGTLRLGGVDVTDEDFTVIYNNMKRASEFSGHDQASARQIDMPTKQQMLADLNELQAFRAIKTKRNRESDERRKALALAPPKAAIG